MLRLKELCKGKLATDEGLSLLMPSKEISVLQEFNKDKLVLTPVTQKVLFVEEQIDESPANLYLGTFDTSSGKTFHIYLQSTVNIKAEFIAPFWMIKTSVDKSECNMELRNIKASCFKFGSECQLPWACNFKKVNAGDELVLFRPSVRKPVKEVEPLEVEKRRRTKM